MIPVTKAFLPPFESYAAQVQRAYDAQWLTNRGQLVCELEEKLRAYLSVPNIIIMNNGTVPIQIALRLLGQQGEIITTPFSYIATSSVIVWEHCKPVFVDIHPEYLTIDETQIESAITPNTKAILATHVFGNPCNVAAIEKISLKYGLSVIYDAAHCFGVDYENKSIFRYGTLSTCSFHATKIFHTAEGGAVFCEDEDLLHQLFYSHNFGHNGPEAFFGMGINAKISELQAAMGLAVLPEMPDIIQARKEICQQYDQLLSFKHFRTLRLREGTNWNYSYYPIVFTDESILLRVKEELNRLNIFPRRYFYPSLNTIPYLAGQHMPVSEKISCSVLCLPLYLGLHDNDVATISDTVNNSVPI
jgi:dTDP-4-amino-4,6-dideoxygalactose transaminase